MKTLTLLTRRTDDMSPALLAGITLGSIAAALCRTALRYRIAVLGSAALAFSTVPAMAGCNSGNVANTDLLTSANCQASATGAFGAVAVGGSANAGGSGSTAIGGASVASTGGAVAVGNVATATGPAAIAIGADSESTAYSSIAIGVLAGARGDHSIALGPVFAGQFGTASTPGYIAFGTSTEVGVHSIAIGNGNQNTHRGASARGSYSVAIGGGDPANLPAKADNTFGVAIGTGAVAFGVRTTSIGPHAGLGAIGSSNRNSAFGSEAGQNVNGGGNTMIGLASGIGVTGDLNSALGNSAGQTVTGFSNTAAGVLAGVTVNGSANVAYGNSSGSSVTGHQNVAIGAHAGKAISASNTIAVGTESKSSKNFGIAIGSFSQATGQYATALGGGNSSSPPNGARAIADLSTAIGFNSSATGHSAMALGRQSWASGAGSVAIGFLSVANVANVVSVGKAGGERRIVNVAQAINPTDAVNLAQVQAMLSAAAVSKNEAKTAKLTKGATRTANRSGRAETGERVFANEGHKRSVADGIRPGLAPVGNQNKSRAPSEAEIECDLGGMKVKTATGLHSTDSASFSALPQGGVEFRQGGSTNGCVTVSFAAEVAAPGSTRMDVRVVLDGRIVAAPGVVIFSEDDGGGLRARSFNFVFPSVAPGRHRVEIEFRNSGSPGSVATDFRSTTVQFVRS